MKPVDHVTSNTRAKEHFPFFIVYATVGILFLIFFLQTYYLYKKSADSDLWVMLTNEILKTIRDVNIDIKAAEAADRGFILTRDPVFMEEYRVAFLNAMRSINRLTSLTRDNPVQQARLNKLRTLLTEKQQMTERLSALFPATPAVQTAAVMPDELLNLTNSIQYSIKTLETTEDQLLEKRSGQNRINNKQRVIFSAVAFSIIMVSLVFAVYKIRFNLIKRSIAESKAKLQEKKYRALVENSAVSMIILDQNGLIRMASMNLKDFLGVEPEDLVDRQLTWYVPEQFHGVIKDALTARPNRDNYNNIIEFRIRTADGDEKLVSCKITPIGEGDAAGGEWQLILWDIDEGQKMRQELKEMQMEAREQQKLIQEIIDNIPMMVFIKDTRGRYRIINQAMAQALGVSPSEVIGRTDRQLGLDPEKVRLYKQADDVVLNTGDVVTVDDEVDTHAGKKYFLITKLPMFNERNEVKYVCGISADVTAFKEVELKLISAKEEAEDARAAQEVFLANISHEIRTPMNGILGMTNLIMDTGLDRAQQEFAESIRESAKSLLTLINDLLDISKVKSGKFQLEAIPFNIEETIRKGIYPLQFKADEKQIGFNLGFNKPELPEIVGDPLRLQQIIINLAGNAIKFTQEGSVDIVVDIHDASPEGISLRVDIKDTGIGIPQDKMKEVFESYTQSDANTARLYGGTGLGLTIVKQLVELQNGRVWVDSNNGKGSVFSFEIPYKISSDNQGQIEHMIGPEHRNIMKGLNILVAEDNLINQKVVKYTLEKSGANVRLTINGREAIEALREGYFDIVLMDMQMPEMDGYEATRYIREELKSKVPVIAMTANALKGEAEKCLEAGATGYISKPFDPATLCAKILQMANNPHEPAKNTDREEDKDPLVDLSYVIELAGDKGDYLKQVLTIFMDNTPDGLNKLEKLIRETEDWQAISTQAHYLKSSVGIIKIRGMHERLQQIETIARDHPDQKEITRLLDELVTIFAEAEPIILNKIEESV